MNFTTRHCRRHNNQFSGHFPGLEELPNRVYGANMGTRLTQWLPHAQFHNKNFFFLLFFSIGVFPPRHTRGLLTLSLTAESCAPAPSVFRVPLSCWFLTVAHFAQPILKLDLGNPHSADPVNQVGVTKYIVENVEGISQTQSQQPLWILWNHRLHN